MNNYYVLWISDHIQIVRITRFYCPALVPYCVRFIYSLIFDLKKKKNEVFATQDI